ncbi:hypothetical protein Tco_1036854 [Tanacetum coccineum]
MSDQKFADTHNLVAFLEKPTESEGFKEIVDFMNVNPIKYALTVNLTVYCSCIKQFWDTAKAKTVNGEVQLQALVDKKKVIITESTIRRDLQLEHAKGTKCLTTATVFEELTTIGAKTTAWNEFSSTMASVIICLATNQKFNFSKYIFDSMVKNVDSMVKFRMYPRRKQRKDTEVSQPSGPTKLIADETKNVKSVPTHSNDPLLSGNLKLNELMKLCTNLQKKVLDLETTKTIQALEINSLKRRVKKLERKQRSRTHKLRRLYKVGLSAKVISSDDEASLGDQEDASKQGRKILDIDADEDITLDSTHVDTDPKTSLDQFNAARPVNTVQSRTTMNNAGPMKNVINNAYSTTRRPFNKITSANNSNFTKKVNTVKGTRVNTARLKVVISVINGNKGNVVKALALTLPDIFPLRHIFGDVTTGNRSYLTDYEEIDGGFVAFGGNSKGAKITRKGKIRTGKLDFEDVYFIKELKFNLFSVSQMCDKKNSVLFTDTECVVLSPV